MSDVTSINGIHRVVTSLKKEGKLLEFKSKIKVCIISDERRPFYYKFMQIDKIAAYVANQSCDKKFGFIYYPDSTVSILINQAKNKILEITLPSTIANSVCDQLSNLIVPEFGKN